MQQKFIVQSHENCEFLNITTRVKTILVSSKVQNGICLVFVPHTTAGVTVNETADADVPKDILKGLERFVPFDNSYAHAEGNSAAHIKTSLMGSSVSLPVVDGRLVLGTWQGIFLCEFDGPRTRSVVVQIIPEPA